MTMSVLVIQHPDGGTAGVFAKEAATRRVTLVPWTPGAGEAIPDRIETFDAVVVLGGGQNVEEADRFPYLRDEIALLRGVLAREQPVLGVCLGHQLLGAATGATIRRSARLEMGFHEVTQTEAGATDPLFRALPDRFTAYGWHSYEVAPSERPALATSVVSLQGLRFGPVAWGVQFHPEVTREILTGWYEDWEADGDLVRSGFDLEAALAALDADHDLDRWMAHGHALFGHFLTLAADAPAQS